jgi:protein-tyrosine kinase
MNHGLALNDVTDLAVENPAPLGLGLPLPMNRKDVHQMTQEGRKPFRRKVSHRGGSADLLPVAAGTPGDKPPEPIDSPRAEWQALRLLAPGVRKHFLGRAPLVNFFRADPAARAFDVLRTRLLQTLRSNGWRRIAIAAPTQGCGSTFTAVNLAQSLARIPGSRTILMDLNQRTPGVAAALGVQGSGDMRGFLNGRVALSRHLVRTGDTLALGLANGVGENTAELLHDVRSGEVLERMSAALRPDVVLYDLPPMLAHDDLAAFLPQVDGVLLVADGTKTLASHIAGCEQILQGQTRLLGVILNRARSCDLETFAA